MRRLGIFLTTVALIAGMVGCGQSTPPEEAVTFADTNLGAAVREAIGMPEGPIYPEDLQALTSLHAYERNIEYLAGLLHCVSLSTLYLGLNQISDISPLANLTNLTDLDLGSNQISDISPLANLSSLIWLGLHHNQIGDISPLFDNAGLDDGDEVWLGENPLSEESIDEYIPELEARGVYVAY